MLSDILQYASEVTNIRGSSAPERAQLLRYVNRAGRELYNGWDLPGSLFERFFMIQTNTQLITLPWYVDEIRGIRRATYASKIELVDMRPRYHYRPWRQKTLQWRLMGECALEQHITQAGRLVCTLAGPETSTITVTVTGQTTTAGLAEEEITIEAGELTAASVNQYTQDQPNGIRSIVKSARTSYDLTISQEVDAREIATIPNHQLVSKNQLIQVHDGNYSLIYSPNEGAEILFKWPYKQLDSDADLFIGTERFDDALVWKLREHWHSTRAGEETLALASAAKCQDLMEKLCFNIESSAEQSVMNAEDGIEFAPRHNYRFARYGQIQ